jgi:signal transduction histidine kinase
MALSTQPTSPPDRSAGAVPRRLNYFWLMVITAIVVGGSVTAGTHHHNLWQSWRGPVMIALSLSFIAWYLLLISGFFHKVPPRQSAKCVGLVWLGAGFLITTALLALDQSFVGLTYALIGTGMFLLRRWSVVPTAVAILLILWAQDLLPPYASGQSWGDAFGGIFNIALSVGIVYAFTAVLRERIRRERLLEELSEANLQLRLAATRDVEMATLRERNRLAREMHDSLGHALVSIAIKLEAARLLSDVDTPRAVAELEDTTALVRSTMTDLRQSLAGLRPAALEEQPLDQALTDLAREMGGHCELAVTCSIDDRAVPLDHGIQETLYRVGQEALTNVAKHARARQVTLSLGLDGDGILMEVGDDGVGLGAAQRPESGRYGVRGMRERVEALGGMLTLGPRPEGGTLLRAWLPAPVRG